MQGGRNLALSGTSQLAVSQEPDSLPLTVAPFLSCHQRHLQESPRPQKSGDCMSGICGPKQFRHESSWFCRGLLCTLTKGKQTGSIEMFKRPRLFLNTPPPSETRSVRCAASKQTAAQYKALRVYCQGAEPPPVSPRTHEAKSGEFIQEHETKPGRLTPRTPVRVDLTKKRTSGQIFELNSRCPKKLDLIDLTVCKHQNSPAASPSVRRKVFKGRSCFSTGDWTEKQMHFATTTPTS